jgi:DNA-binding NarL/FixJ family response regulator
VPMNAPTKRRIRTLVAAGDPGYLYKLVGKVTSGKDMMVKASAHTWREAVEKLLASRPDVALLELHMAGVPQVKVMKKAQPNARLILLVGTEDAGLDIPKSLGSPVEGVVRKNAPRKRLLQCIRTVYKGGTCLPVVRRKKSDAA